MTLNYSHLGICVSDLDRSLRFYCDGLGFEKAETYQIGSEFGAGLEVPGDLDLTSQFIRRDGVAIELLYYASPGFEGTPSSQRNQLGITHLSFIVDDVDESAAKLVAAGGTILDNTRVNVGIQILFLADPDGTRIELMTAP